MNVRAEVRKNWNSSGRVEVERCNANTTAEMAAVGTETEDPTRSKACLLPRKGVDNNNRITSNNKDWAVDGEIDAVILSSDARHG